MSVIGQIFDYLFLPADIRGGPIGGAPAPEPGTMFSNRDSSGTPEFARVIGNTIDDLGVRHIRFDLSYRFQHREVEAGERTLAQDAFQRRFELVKDC